MNYYKGTRMDYFQWQSDFVTGEEGWDNHAKFMGAIKGDNMKSKVFLLVMILLSYIF